jgi:DNA-binding GntR family transcriptional regulator
MHLSASQRAYDHVKTRILDARYPGGDLLTEGQVSTETGVSRTPVREALLRLEAEGLVRLYPKKGALVVPFTAQGAADVLEARGLVERYCAPRAWARRAEFVDYLPPLLEAMREARRAGDVTAFTTADRSFHEQIVAAAGNDVLTRLYRSLRERQLCITAALARVSTDRMDAAIDDHAVMIDLLHGEDQTAFLALVDEHLDQALAHAQASQGQSARGADR